MRRGGHELAVEGVQEREHAGVVVLDDAVHARVADPQLAQLRLCALEAPPGLGHLLSQRDVGPFDLLPLGLDGLVALARRAQLAVELLAPAAQVGGLALHEVALVLNRGVLRCQPGQLPPLQVSGPVLPHHRLAHHALVQRARRGLRHGAALQAARCRLQGRVQLLLAAHALLHHREARPLRLLVLGQGLQLGLHPALRHVGQLELDLQQRFVRARGHECAEAGVQRVVRLLALLPRQQQRLLRLCHALLDLGQVLTVLPHVLLCIHDLLLHRFRPSQRAKPRRAPG
mmetsp:Transcript_64094/g.164929  ORF Transcript_64094/g.164929 Transcript_64094/m.164929 type:complete len:287 (+) Transcript_64094:636-1496(+)